MINLLKQLFGFGDAPSFGGIARSPKWPETKRKFEKIEPKKCAACGETRVQLHHRKPFHAHPELENDLKNLVWLCEGVMTNHHHLWLGHLGNFQSVNENLDQWIEDIRHRPSWDGTNNKWKYVAKKSL